MFILLFKQSFSIITFLYVFQTESKAQRRSTVLCELILQLPTVFDDNEQYEVSTYRTVLQNQKAVHAYL